MKLSSLLFCLLVHVCTISSIVSKTTQQTSSQALGKHLIIELYDCDPDAINNVKSIEETMLAAAHEAGATIVTHSFHQFSPYGFSGAVIISESHFTIHTWPEHGYCAVDIFTCGDLNNDAAFEVIKNGLKAKSFSRIELRRGILSPSEKFKAFDTTDTLQTQETDILIVE